MSPRRDAQWAKQGEDWFVIFLHLMLPIFEFLVVSKINISIPGPVTVTVIL
jgi:hypothetical protein